MTKQLNRQNNEGMQKHDITPRQSSVQTNHKVNTSNIQTTLHMSRKMLMYPSPRQVLPLAPTIGSGGASLSPQYTR